MTIYNPDRDRADEVSSSDLAAYIVQKTGFEAATVYRLAAEMRGDPYVGDAFLELANRETPLSDRRRPDEETLIQSVAEIRDSLQKASSEPEDLEKAPESSSPASSSRSRFALAIVVLVALAAGAGLWGFKTAYVRMPEEIAAGVLEAEERGRVAAEVFASLNALELGMEELSAENQRQIEELELRSGGAR